MLKIEPNIADFDGFYEALVGLHRNLTPEQSQLVNSKLISLWGWDAVVTIQGTNTCWYLAQAKDAGARMISVDPRYTDTAATFVDEWIPIRPNTDAACPLPHRTWP